MSRTYSSPVLYLSEPVYSRRTQSQASLHTLDYAFLSLALTIICGGCLFLMDLASAHNAGRESITLSFLSHIATALPSLLHGAAHYVVLFLSSVLSSAMIVGLVFALRSLDRKVTGMTNSPPRFTTVSQAKVANHSPYKTAIRGRETSIFLLSPVFQ